MNNTLNIEAMGFTELSKTEAEAINGGSVIVGIIVGVAVGSLCVAAGYYIAKHLL